MLRWSSGPNPAHQNFRSLRTALIAFATVAVLAIAPSLADAATYEADLLDPDGSGYGASVLIDDASDPENLTISIDSLPEGAGGDIMAFSITYDVAAYHPAMTVSGSDVGSFRTWFSGASREEPCPCNVLSNFGGSDLFELTGLTSTSFSIAHPTEELTLEALAGATVRIFIGFSLDQLDAPGKVIKGVRALKLDGEIQPIPEPSTAALMLLGLMGLAGGSRRLEQ